MRLRAQYNINVWSFNKHFVGSFYFNNTAHYGYNHIFFTFFHFLLFKIYLTNPSLRCALFQPISETDTEIGNMVETAVYAQWIPRLGVDIAYANWRISKKQQGEVDIVGMDAARQKPYWAVEVKWSDRYAEHP